MEINGKIALCLYGQPRFIDNPASFRTHKAHILDRYETDVFCHYWFEPSIKLFNHSDFSKAPGGRQDGATIVPYVHPDTEQIINDIYQPKLYKIEAPQDFPLPPNQDSWPNVIKDYPSYRDRNLKNYKSHLYSWQTVLEMFSKWRAENNVKYDWVALSRYDALLGAFPSFDCLPKNMSYFHATFDVGIIAPEVCGLLKPYTHFDSFILKAPYFDPASWKKLAFSEASVPCCVTETIDMYDLVRSR